MNTYEEKKSLLLEMIAFSTINGHLNKKEYDFLFIISNVLDIKKGGFNDLLLQELPVLPKKTEFLRLIQFYRLARLTQTEALLPSKEAIAIHRIAISMGLKTEVAKRILEKINNNPKAIITNEVLFEIFQEERN